jgi:hypothetical protein
MCLSLVCDLTFFEVIGELRLIAVGKVIKTGTVIINLRHGWISLVHIGTVIIGHFGVELCVISAECVVFLFFNCGG